MAAQPSKFLSISFPILDDTSTNYFLKRTQTTMDSVKSDLFFLLTTQVGERYYDRSFGCDLFALLFEPNDEPTFEAIEKAIKTAVNTFLPKLTITNITDSYDPNNNNLLYLTVNFTYTDDFFNQQDFIVIPIQN